MESQNTADKLGGILAFQSVHERLVTSGQPTLEQFGWIAAAGFGTVINLALTDASNAVAGEDRRVLELGMDYIQLPLLFNQPSPSQALRVLALIDSLKSEKIWLHCALNMRVSSLMYLYRTHYLAVDDAEAQGFLHKIWSPDPVWSALISAVQQHLRHRP